jgi:catechol 2,3-dioxygenase-like lactoylglutathione lyase family enzyme
VGDGARVRRGMKALAVLVAAAALSVAPSLRQGQPPAAAQPPARPVVAGIAHVAIQTSDLAKARAFYGELLGYPEMGPRRPHTAIFVVNDRQRLIVRDGLPPERDERFIDLAFEANVNAMRDWLIGHGTAAGDAAADPDAGGRRIETKDPDGHPVQFVELGPARVRSLTASPDRRLSRRILHAGLTIKDGAAADRFYKEILGFSETWRGGRPEGVINWINMRVPDGTDYIEYMLYPAAPPNRSQLGSAHHVALLVTDIQQALETVRARTAPGDRNHRANPSIGVNNRWQLNLFDPDGTRVELMEPWTVR